MIADQAFLPPSRKSGHRHADLPPGPTAGQSLDLRIAGVIFASVIASLGGIFGAIELSARHTRIAIDGELKAIHTELAGHTQRMDKMDGRFDRIEARMDRMEDRMERGFARLEDKIDKLADYMGMYGGTDRPPVTQDPKP